MHFLASGTWSIGDVFGAQLLVQSRLKGRNILCCVLAYAALSFLEGVRGGGSGVWHPDGCGSTAMLVANTGVNRSEAESIRKRKEWEFGIQTGNLGFGILTLAYWCVVMLILGEVERACSTRERRGPSRCHMLISALSTRQPWDPLGL